MAFAHVPGQTYKTVNVIPADPYLHESLGPLYLHFEGTDVPLYVYLTEADAREIHDALHAYFADADEPASSAPADRFYVVQGGPGGELLQVVERDTGRQIAAVLGPS